MPEADLLLSLAEIAGVFLGFGALISVRSASTSDTFELTIIRMVVETGIQVVVVALVPVVLGNYGITDHEVWLLSSLAFLAVVWGMWAMDMRVPETRALTVAMSRTRQAVSMVFFVPQQVALVLVVLGLLPDQEPALYVTAAGLLLVFAATFLLSLALPFGRPQPASEVAPHPA